MPHPTPPWALTNKRRPYETHERGSATAFYRTKTWRKARASVLNVEPLCRECYRAGLTTEASVVDHIRPRRDGGADYDPTNLQPLCRACHARKSGREAHMSQ